MSLNPIRNRPENPLKDDDFWEVTTAERQQRAKAYHQDLASWWFESAGYRVMGDDEEWILDESAYGCTECIAGSNGTELLVRGTDSHGDCAEDGEPVYRVIKL